jgi:hypothetical protein
MPCYIHYKENRGGYWKPVILFNLLSGEKTRFSLYYHTDVLTKPSENSQNESFWPCQSVLRRNCSQLRLERRSGVKKSLWEETARQSRL